MAFHRRNTPRKASEAGLFNALQLRSLLSLIPLTHASAMMAVETGGSGWAFVDLKPA